MAKRSLFNQGYGGLSDSPYSGQPGAVFKSVGIDHKSKPGVLRAHQALKNGSGSTINELCDTSIALKDGSTLWFGETKVWREENGVFEQKYELKGTKGDIINVSGGTAAESKKLGRASQVVRFSDDGYYLFTLDRNGSLDQFTLTKAFDVTTAVLKVTKSITARSFAIGRDGTRLFVLNKNTVDVYDMAIFDIASAVKKISHDLSSHVTSGIDIEVSDDGNSLYVLDRNGYVYQYGYSTPWGGEYATFWVLGVAGGGGGGGVDATTGTGDWRRSGGGGAGGFMEDTNFALTTGISYTITVGAGGNGGAAGDEHNGVKGGDTSAFGIVLKGGGYGGQTNTAGNNNAYPQNGGPGGSGGGAGRFNDYGGGQGGAREDCSPRAFGGIAGQSGPGSGGGLSAKSSITGSVVTYAVGGSSRNGNNPGINGTDGTGNGGSGAATEYPGGRTAQAGGNGGSGTLALRFKTSGVASYTQTGGTVTTIGDDTLIVWGTSGGTFEFAYTSTLTYVSSKLVDGNPNGFSINESRVVFAFNEYVKQFGITGNDITSIVYSDIILKSDSSLSKNNNISSVYMAENYLFIGWETGVDITDYNVTRYKFIDPGDCFCSAVEHSVLIQVNAKSGIVADLASKNVGGTSLTDTTYNGSTTMVLENSATISVDTQDAFDRGIKALVFKQDDLSYIGRGYIQSVSGTSVKIYFDDSLSSGLNAYGRKVVVVDQVVISGDSQFGYTGQSVLEPTQGIIFKKDTEIDTLLFSLREGPGLNGGYTLRVKLKDDDGTVLREVTKYMGTSSLSYAAETLIPFEFTKLTLKSGIKYTVSITIDDLSSLNFDLKSRRYLVIGVQSRTRGISYDTALNLNELRVRLYDSSIVDSEADQIQESRIYFASKTGIYYINSADVAGDWSGKVTPVGEFKNGHDEHEMIVTNNVVYISDGQDLAIIAENGVFAQTSMFNLPEREKITAMGNYDVDTIIGTSLGRVLRYPFLSDSWIAEDTVPEGRINAIIKDDNYTYISAGTKGRIYFYNGAALEQTITFAGDFANTNGVVINKRAVGFINNSPIFGLSNVSGNPVMQGVYGLGSFGKNYRKVLTLDYPLSNGFFDNIEIGSLVTVGSKVLVSWKRGNDYGVDILDDTKKYDKAYFETTTIMSNEELGYLRSVVSIDIPYARTLSNADLNVSYRAQDTSIYKDITVTRDNKRNVFAGQKNLSEVGNVHLKVDFNVVDNDSPEIVDLLFDITADNKD